MLAFAKETKSKKKNRNATQEKQEKLID